MTAGARYAAGIAEALAEFGPVESSSDRWRLSLDGTPVVASLAAPWLVMTSSVADAASPGQLLDWNAALPGRVKFALSEDGHPEVRSEIPLDDESPSAVRQACSGFQVARAVLHGEPPQLAENLTPVAAPQDDLARLTTEAGWSPTLRDDQSVAIELECPQAFAQASFAPHPLGVRISVPLGSFADAQPVSTQAVEIFMLTAATHIRMARPALEAHDGKVTPRFETLFTALPSVAHLAHALSALSIAFRWCAEEVKALQDADVAGEFLALRHRRVAVPEPHENIER
jgi:hypothetical protein